MDVKTLHHARNQDMAQAQCEILRDSQVPLSFCLPPWTRRPTTMTFAIDVVPNHVWSFHRSNGLSCKTATMSCVAQD
ncbi:hypothetical protein NFI96_020223 [Prochilodus magdalenae]|nr:hypothetical protein NFI96_020223 [Prochilodus magdalenae]